MNATLKQFQACVLVDSLEIEATCAARDRTCEPSSDSSTACNFPKALYVPEEGQFLTTHMVCLFFNDFIYAEIMQK